MILVFAVKLLDNIELFRFNKLLRYVSKDKHSKIKRFFKPGDALKTLISDILVRTIVCKKLNKRNEEIFITYDRHGKPYLKDIPNFHFSISHSERWVICAIDNSPIGIDIELIKPIDFNIARRFFSNEEYMELMKKDKSERLDCFYDLWTLKESYIKFIGKGLLIPLDSFTIKFCGSNIKVETKSNFENCFFKQYSIDNKYKLSVCATNKNFPENVFIKGFEELCDEI